MSTKSVYEYICHADHEQSAPHPLTKCQVFVHGERCRAVLRPWTHLRAEQAYQRKRKAKIENRHPATWGNVAGICVSEGCTRPAQVDAYCYSHDAAESWREAMYQLAQSPKSTEPDSARR